MGASTRRKARRAASCSALAQASPAAAKQASASSRAASCSALSRAAGPAAASSALPRLTSSLRCLWASTSGSAWETSPAAVRSAASLAAVPSVPAG